MRIFTETSGSMVSAYLINNINESGHESVASDIDEFNHGVCLANKFIKVPKSNDPNLWSVMENKLLEANVDIVIPSFDETLLYWSKKKEYFKSIGIDVIISNIETIDIFLDKYKAYKFCIENEIPTPKTSLAQDFKLVKPRFGRGGSGIYIGYKKQNMEDMISQELINGVEYTVDCLFDKDSHPIYIIPRIRMDIKDGKSTKGIVVQHDVIIAYIKLISRRIEFIGPINFQFIETKDKSVYFLEVNPRISGGMALSIAASENWITCIVDNFINNKKIKPKKINYGLKMMRYYAECFI